MQGFQLFGEIDKDDNLTFKARVCYFSLFLKDKCISSISKYFPATTNCRGRHSQVFLLKPVLKIS